MLRPWLIPAIGLAALAGGCDGEQSVRITSTSTRDDASGVLKVVDALQCPESIGVLSRKGSATAGGRTCTYTGPKGAEVTLHLVDLADRDIDSVLNRFETDLARDLPEAAAEIRADQARRAAEAARADAEAARADATAAEASAQAAADTAHVRMPGVQVDAEGDNADVRLPGLSVHAKGDRATVRIGPIHISADDSGENGGSANITIPDGEGGETVSINAHNQAAEIRRRAGGEAVRATYILTSETANTQRGWRLVGYEARGPAGGPMVIATIRTKARREDASFDAAQELVTLNVGD